MSHGVCTENLFWEGIAKMYVLIESIPYTISNGVVNLTQPHSTPPNPDSLISIYMINDPLETYSRDWELVIQN